MFGKRRNKDIKSQDNAGPPFLQEGDLPSLTIMSFQQINLVTNNINKNISLDFALLTLATVATPSDLPVWEGKQNKPENCRRKSPLQCNDYVPALTASAVETPVPSPSPY